MCGKRMPGLARDVEVRAGDMLVVEGDPESIEDAVGGLGLEYMGTGEGVLAKADLVLAEVVVPESSRLAGRTPMSLRLLYRYRVAIVGVSRREKRFREHVRKLETILAEPEMVIHARDILRVLVETISVEEVEEGKHLLGIEGDLTKFPMTYAKAAPKGGFANKSSIGLVAGVGFEPTTFRL